MYAVKSDPNLQPKFVIMQKHFFPTFDLHPQYTRANAFFCGNYIFLHTYKKFPFSKHLFGKNSLTVHLLSQNFEQPSEKESLPVSNEKGVAIFQIFPNEK